MGGAALVGLAAIVTGVVARHRIVDPYASRTMVAQPSLGAVLGLLGVVAGVFMMGLGWGLAELGGGGA